MCNNRKAAMFAYSALKRIGTNEYDERDTKGQKRQPASCTCQSLARTVLIVSLDEFPFTTMLIQLIIIKLLNGP